ncbi:MAG: GIY-YIG nuclease family protein [Candidatus Eremiobacteraeota bacterium]|nr:GIY-YIG nuclease family protein [Candidatus Eremiobacteraeota bacterium]
MPKHRFWDFRPNGLTFATPNSRRVARNHTACFVYVLVCADGSLYTGWCRNLERRIAAHRRGRGSKYVRSRLPCRLATFWAVANSSLARKEEAAFKRLRRDAKLRALQSTLPHAPFLTRQ